MCFRPVSQSIVFVGAGQRRESRQAGQEEGIGYVSFIKKIQL